MISLDYLKSLNHDVTEVRIFTKDRYALGRGSYTGNICFGYYDKDHYQKMIDDIKKFDDSENIEGIYTTIQRCDPALLARAENRIQMDAKTGMTTSDNNITHYTMFPVDIDPKRVPKVSSSSSELAVAQNAAKHLALGILSPFSMIKSMSGNGYHILIPIVPLENTEENTARWKRLGDIIAIDIIGAMQDVDGDEKVYNAARIFKLYGTMARKGDSTDERPHRRSKLYTEDWSIIKRHTIEELEEVLLPLEKEGRTADNTLKDGASRPGGGSANMTLQEWLNQNNIAHNSPKETRDGTIYPMQCPFDESHGTDAYAIQLKQGKWGWSCFHNGCSGNGWAEFREKVAPKNSSFNPGAAKGYQPKMGYIDPETNEIHDIDDIQDVPDDRLEFPADELMGDTIYDLIRGACHNRQDLASEFLHAVVTNNIGATLGRSVYLADDPPVWPNMYHVLVGETGFAQKTQVTKLGKILMRMSDECVNSLSTLATAEGLIDIFVFPKGLYPGSKIPDDYEAQFNATDFKERRGIGKHFDLFTPVTDSERSLRSIIENTWPFEGIRIQLVQNEMAALLSKSKKNSSIGLVQTITELFDMEDVVTSPTKGSPTTAFFPCFSVITSTTQTWLEKNLNVDDIHAGFINRFCFYKCKDIDLESKRMFGGEIDKKLIGGLSKCLNVMRNEVFKVDGENPRQYEFTVSNEAKEYCEAWHTEMLRSVETVTSDIIRDSLSRFALHCKKFALIYAVLEILDKKIDKCEVSLDAMKRACLLSKYHTAIARNIFGEFTSSEAQKIEDLVLKKIRKHGTRGVTAREIANSTRRASIEQITRAIEVLHKNNFIGQTPIPYNPTKFRWHALKDIDLDNLQEK